MRKIRLLKQGLAVLLSLSMGLGPCAPGSFAAYAETSAVEADVEEKAENTDADDEESSNSGTEGDTALSDSSVSEDTVPSDSSVSEDTVPEEEETADDGDSEETSDGSSEEAGNGSGEEDSDSGSAAGSGEDSETDGQKKDKEDLEDTNSSSESGTDGSTDTEVNEDEAGSGSEAASNASGDTVNKEGTSGEESGAGSEDTETSTAAETAGEGESAPSEENEEAVPSDETVLADVETETAPQDVEIEPEAEITENAFKSERRVLQEEVDGVTVSVIYDDGVFPENVTMEVRKVDEDSVEQEEIREKVEKALKEKKAAEATDVETWEGTEDETEKAAEAEASKVYLSAFEIHVLDENGEQVEPHMEKGEAFVRFKGLSVPDGENQAFSIDDIMVFGLKDTSDDKVKEMEIAEDPKNLDLSVAAEGVVENDLNSESTNEIASTLGTTEINIRMKSGITGYLILLRNNKESILREGEILFAERYGNSSSNIYWDLTNGVLTITGSGKWGYYPGYIPWDRASIKKVIVQEGITNIPAETFSACKELVTADIPDSVTSIGWKAFNSCESLSEVSLPQDLKTIGSSAFRYCRSLVSIIIPPTVEELGEEAFSGCSQLGGKIIVPGSIKDISNKAFAGCKSITELTILNGTESIGNYAFSGCSELKNVTLPKSISSIGESAFSNCTNITDDLLLDNVEVIEKSAFDSCAKLETVTLLKTKIIKDDAFRACNNLSSLYLSKDITRFYTGALYGCDSLTDVYYEGSEEEWNLVEIDHLSKPVLERANIHFNSVRSEVASGKCGDNLNWKIIGVEGNYTLVIDGEGEMYDFDYDDQPWKDYKTSLKKLSLGNGITRIGNNAFNSYEGLSGKLVIPESVRFIGRTAFAFCSGFTGDLVIPDSVEGIDRYAFEDCSGFNGKLVLNPMTEIGYGVFSDCSGFTGDLVIPEGVTNISFWSFIRCSGFNGDLILPDSLKVIMSGAFEECTGFTGTIVLPPGLETLGIWVFKKTNFKNIVFTGDAPEGHNIFDQHTVYYPQNNSTWTEEIREELGESAVWIPYDEGTTPWIKYDIYYVDENKEVVTKTFEHDLTYYVKQKQSTDYNPELAFMLSCFASSAYNDENIKKSLAGMGFDTSDSGSVFEYYDANNHEDTDHSASVAYSITKKKCSDGTVIVPVILRGTTGDGPGESLLSYWKKTWSLEWYGNIDFENKPGFHKNFYQAADEIYEELSEYLKNVNGDYRIVLTGHSRGAAVSNLLTCLLMKDIPKERIYSYNFACPDNARGPLSCWNEDGEYNNIFNIGNIQDPVAKIPGAIFSVAAGKKYKGTYWGKFGRTYFFSTDWSDESAIVTDLTFKAHESSNYIKYLKDKPQLSSFKTWEQAKVTEASILVKEAIPFGRCINIFCPVNAVVYGEDGEEIVRIVNDQVVNCDDENVLLNISDDEKQVFVFGDNQLKVDLAGTDNGEMDYSVCDIGSTFLDVISDNEFQNVKLEPSKTMVSYIENREVEGDDNSKSDVSLFVTDENNNTISEILRNGEEITAIPVKKLSISVGQDIVRAGDCFRMSRFILPTSATNQRVFWSSSDTTIASVDQKGYVKAKKAGTVTITAVAEDGLIEKQCTIEVKRTGDIFWGINSDGVLKISSRPLGDNFKGSSFDADSVFEAYGTPWETYSNNITKIVVGEKGYPVKPLSTASWFCGLWFAKTIEMTYLDTSAVTDMSNMFAECQVLETLDLSNFSTSKVTDMSSMFSGCLLLKNLDVSNLDTSNVVNMRRMFSHCENLQNLDLSSFDTHKVNNMEGMFFCCHNLTALDVSGFDTRNVTTMREMFAFCDMIPYLGTESFNTENVTDMDYMFRECFNLQKVNTSSFKTTSVVYMNGMFTHCEKLENIDVKSFDTKNTVSFGSMFSYCYSLKHLDLSSFDTRNTVQMGYMFKDCEKLESIIVGDFWSNDKLSYSGGMFENCILLKGEKGTVYSDDHKDAEYGRVDGGTEAPGYFTSIHSIVTDPVEAFIRRLYTICLGREADDEGLAYWKGRINSGSIKGIALAGNFVFSNEFTSKNYCNEHFVRQIYPALMGREPDDEGFAYWVGELGKGMKRETLLNSFTSSNEYKKLCAEAGIELGAKLNVPQYGRQQYGPCAVCGSKSKVVQFVERMYTECMKRPADDGGLAFWSKGLYEHTFTGKTVLYNFFLSSEIKNMGLANQEYVRRIYKTMMDRDPDDDGLNYWTRRLDTGDSPKAVINGFIDSSEFTKICNDYGIVRK